jgi:hypothetical protein
MKAFVSVVKIITFAESKEDACEAVQDLLNSDPAVKDWGFTRTEEGRAFPRQVEVPEEYFQMKREVEAIETPENYREEKEAMQRLVACEAVFDSIGEREREELPVPANN